MCTSDFICFYDWAEWWLIRRIDVNVKNVYWADSGDLVTIASDLSFYILCRPLRVCPSSTAACGSATGPRLRGRRHQCGDVVLLTLCAVKRKPLVGGGGRGASARQPRGEGVLRRLEASAQVPVRLMEARAQVTSREASASIWVNALEL
ncbi:unnamed protein product [Urochloa humidicola]